MRLGLVRVRFRFFWVIPHSPADRSEPQSLIPVGENGRAIVLYAGETIVNPEIPDPGYPSFPVQPDQVNAPARSGSDFSFLVPGNGVYIIRREAILTGQVCKFLPIEDIYAS